MPYDYDCSESLLRKAVIRLAHENPDGIRHHLMPLLKKASQSWRQVTDLRQWEKGHMRYTITVPWGSSEWVRTARYKIWGDDGVWRASVTDFGGQGYGEISAPSGIVRGGGRKGGVLSGDTFNTPEEAAQAAGLYHKRERY